MALVNGATCTILAMVLSKVQVNNPGPSWPFCLMVGDKAFLFHVHIPCGKTLSLVPRFRSSSSNIKVKFRKKKNMPFQGIRVS